MEDVLVTIRLNYEPGEELFRQDSRGYLANVILVAYTLSYWIVCTSGVYDIMYKRYSLTKLLNGDRPGKVLPVVTTGSRKPNCNSNSVQDQSLDVFGVK